jgi:transcriptional regulator with XRE-family HTH domain
MKLRIRELREEAGLTQQQLGDAAGLSKPFVSQLETGRRQPSSQTIRALADYFGRRLGTNLTDLFDVGDEKAEFAALVAVHDRLPPEKRDLLLQLAVALLDDPAT